MRLSDTITLWVYAGGPGSGCQGPDCGRKPGLRIEQKQDENTTKRFMTLTLNTHSMPLLFENDADLTWYWSSDKKNLHIEQVETKKTDFPTGFTQKEVIDVPAENIKEWFASDSPSSEWRN
jgi:hypothetical protein